jgi:hypothetical protein
MLLKQSFQHANADPLSLQLNGSYVQLGGFSGLKHQPSDNSVVTIGLTYGKLNNASRNDYVSTRMGFAECPNDKYRGDLLFAEYQMSDRQLHANIRLKPVDEVDRLEKGGWNNATFAGANTDFHLADGSSIESMIDFYCSGNQSLTQNDRDSLRQCLKETYFEIVNGLPVKLAPRDPLSSIWNTHMAKRMRTNYFHAVARDMRNSLIDKTRYLGPLRGYPQRLYSQNGRIANAVAEGQSVFMLHQLMQGIPSFKTQFQNALKQLEIPYVLTVHDLGNESTGQILACSLIDNRNGANVTLADVGFGIGQLLPIVVEGFSCNGSLICIEQPELHLHPRLQANLADFIISRMQETMGNNYPDMLGNQWLLETHSEALMLRIQRRIREKVLNPYDVSVLFVQPDGSGSYVNHLRLDDDGEFIDEWPGGFFEERFNETFNRIC